MKLLVCVRLEYQEEIPTFEEYGIIKAAKSLEAVDPSREAIQAQRYSVLAAQYGVSIELIQKVFRTVIDEVVANHQAIRESTLK